MREAHLLIRKELVITETGAPAMLVDAKKN
jgi:hypothetical protein